MPMLPELSPELLFATLAALASAVGATGLLALWRIRSRQAAAALATVAMQVSALRAAAGSQSATLVALAAHFDALQERLTTDARYAGGAPAGAGASAYELAIRLARGGASVDELVSACTLSRREAELTLRLHGSRSSAAPGRLAGVA